jgi:hypothetical protein
VGWARSLIEAALSARDDLVRDIELHAHKSPLGGGYEAGNVVAIGYERGSIPAPTVLVDDLLFMMTLLGDLYRAEEASPGLPGDLPPEVVEANEIAEKLAGRRAAYRRGQGFRLTMEERRAVELHSVQAATRYLAGLGWTIRDVGAKRPYDLLARRGKETLHVEVKGTTSEGTQVILTRAEVEQQQKLAPDNALIIVHSIKLDRTTTPATATGGTLYCVSPWTIETDDLTVVSFIYRTGLSNPPA